jgi:hypothetical protein
VKLHQQRLGASLVDQAPRIALGQPHDAPQLALADPAITREPLLAQGQRGRADLRCLMCDVRTLQRGLAFAVLSFQLLAGSTAVAAPVDERNSLIGLITESGSPKFIKVGAQVTFTDLKTDSPTVVWPDSGDSKTTKIFENENLVIIQAVSPVGSTETIYLEKKNRRFTAIAVGAFSIVDKSKAVGVSSTTYRGVFRYPSLMNRTIPDVRPTLRPLQKPICP